MNNEKKAKDRVKYAVREVGASLRGGGNEITVGSDVSSEPFPFSEEDNEFHEQLQLKRLDRNEP